MAHNQATRLDEVMPRIELDDLKELKAKSIERDFCIVKKRFSRQQGLYKPQSK